MPLVAVLAYYPLPCASILWRGKIGDSMLDYFVPSPVQPRYFTGTGIEKWQTQTTAIRSGKLTTTSAASEDFNELSRCIGVI